MRLNVILHLTGTIVRVFGVMLLVPLALAVYDGDRHDATGFVVAALIAGIAGQLAARAGSEGEGDLRRVEGMTVVAAAWLAVAVVAAVPYVWAGIGPIDALFESMSGLTTTGATIIADFSRYGRSIFLWRGMTQWLGGMGVIALFVAVLPRLAIAGRQLFFAEAPGPTDEKLAPQVRRTAAMLWRLYVALSALEVAALAAAGMPLYDAVCNTMATLAAGGFSPHPQSIAGYANPLAEWIIVAFMFLAGANFALQYRVVRGHPRALVDDEEFRAYAGVVIAASALLAFFLWRSGFAVAGAVRHGLFQVVSIITTTGFASVDFQTWTDQAKGVLLAVMFIGGCAGSAGGGPKVVRYLLIARFTRVELRRALHPRALLPVKLNGRVVPDEVIRAVLAFFLAYLGVYAVSVVIVVSLGADLITGITATIVTLGNIGPGFGLVGPMSSFGHLHPVSKIVLTLAMWLGRLEVITVLVLLRPEVWRVARWRERPPRPDAPAAP